MAIKTKYRIKNSNNEYDILHFQTSADQVITNDELQFVSKEEKEKLQKIKNYVHNQIASAKIWEIQHNLDRFPSVSIVDSAGSLVVGEIYYIDTNNIRISFSSTFSGKAYLN